MGKTHKVFTSRTNVDSSTFIGEAGRIFYDETIGELRLSDGVTPGGLPVAGGGSGGYTGSQGDSGGYTGSAGHTGYTGYTGSASTIAGYTGSQGAQGPAGGYTGSTGAGYTGSQGDIGFTGFTGFNGSRGFVGSSGLAGGIGYVGSAGNTGSQGLAGFNGSIGFIGSQGLAGFNGSLGYTGSVGPQGAGFVGSQGIAGYTGSDGITGYSGSIGFVGSQGVIGFIGSTGFNGSQGIQGVSASFWDYKTNSNSTSGDPGNGKISWNNATQVNSSVLNINHINTGGIDLDTFIDGIVVGNIFTIQDTNDASNYQIWEVTGPSTTYVTYDSFPILLIDSGGIGTTDFPNNHNIIVITNRQGSQGYTGSIGLQGNIGYTGSTGNLGFTGSVGNLGFTGSQGAGFVGSQGDVGNQGTTGFAGSQGDIGYIGSTGGLGGQGYTGSIGDIGYVGSQGVPGDQYHTFSTSTLTIPASGNFSIVIGTNLAYSVDQTIIVHAVLDSNDHINGTVVSYDNITGALVAAVTTTTGTGETYSNWVINLSGAVGSIGFTGSQGTTGFFGSQGYFGSQGAVGFVGSQGTQGTTGFVGSIGFVGSTGFTGSTGFIGSKGTTGFVGSQGIGYVGSQGVTGGSTGQLLFNDNGIATGTNNLLFDGTNLTVQGLVAFNNTATIHGDVHITQDLTVDGTINFVGTATILQGNSGQFFGDTIGNGALYAGVTSFTPFPQTVIQATGDYNGFIELNVQNVNSGPQSSTDIVATADNGTLETAYIDLGITGSTWDGTQPNTLGNALSVNDGYVFVAGPSAGEGNLVLGTNSTGTQVKIVAGGADSTLVVAVFNAVNTISTSTNTGALILTGGLGVQGNVNLSTDKKITVGSDVSAVSLPNVPAQFSGNVNSYFQINSQNVNTGTLASTDIVLTADNGNDTNFYIDLGIASSNAAVPGQEVIGPNDGYLYVQGNDLVIGTGAAGKNVEFYTSGLSTSSSTHHVMTLADSTVTIYNSLNVTGPIYQNGIAIGNSIGFHTITTSTMLQSIDQFVFASGTITITLPDATINTGKRMQIKKIDGGAITVITTSTQTIDGYTSMTMTEVNSLMGLISDGNNWFIN